MAGQITKMEQSGDTENMKVKRINPARLRPLFGALISIFLAFLVGSVLIAAIGGRPLEAYRYMLSGAFGNMAALSSTLNKTAVLLLCGLSCAAAYRCGLINIGAQGQLLMGALSAGFAGLCLEGMPAFLVILFSFMAGMAGGAVWGAIAGWLKVRFGASEVITTVMLNYIALHFFYYMINGPLKDPVGEAAKSRLLDERYWLPASVGKIHLGILLAILCLAAFALFFTRTKAGFAMRITGLNPRTALHAGINVSRQWLISMAISGALAGLAGAVEVFGTQHQLISGFGNGYGFDGIAVALLGGGSSLGLLGAGLLFGAMKTGGSQMQMFGRVPNAIVGVIQGLIIMLVLVDIYGRVYRQIQRRRNQTHRNGKFIQRRRNKNSMHPHTNRKFIQRCNSGEALR